MRKTWTQKLDNGRSAERVILEKPYCGVPAGTVMLVSTPREVEDYIRAVPPGVVVSPRTLRDDLAAQHGAETTCPTTTGIFLRIVAEAALDQVAAGADWSHVAPFWRVVDPDSPTAKKISGGSELIRRMRQQESDGYEPASRVAAVRSSRLVARASSAGAPEI